MSWSFPPLPTPTCRERDQQTKPEQSTQQLHSHTQVWRTSTGNVKDVADSSSAWWVLFWWLFINSLKPKELIYTGQNWVQTLPQRSALIKTQDKRRYFRYQQEQRVVAEKQNISHFGRIRLMQLQCNWVFCNWDRWPFTFYIYLPTSALYISRSWNSHIIPFI